MKLFILATLLACVAAHNIDWRLPNLTIGDDIMNKFGISRSDCDLTQQLMKTHVEYLRSTEPSNETSTVISTFLHKNNAKTTTFADLSKELLTALEKNIPDEKEKFIYKNMIEWLIAHMIDFAYISGRKYEKDMRTQVEILQEMVKHGQFEDEHQLEMVKISIEEFTIKEHIIRMVVDGLIDDTISNEWLVEAFEEFYLAGESRTTSIGSWYSEQKELQNRSNAYNDVLTALNPDVQQTIDMAAVIVDLAKFIG